MKSKRVVTSAFSLMGVCAVAISGCGDTEVKLADVPPAQISPNKQSEASTKTADLKRGSPPKGSSSGINFNPSDSGGAR